MKQSNSPNKLQHFTCTEEPVKKHGGRWAEQRGGGSSVFEPLVRGGSFNSQLPMGVGHPVVFFLTGIGTHLTQSTTEVTPSSYNGAKIGQVVTENVHMAGVQ